MAAGVAASTSASVASAMTGDGSDAASNGNTGAGTAQRRDACRTFPPGRVTPRNRGRHRGRATDPESRFGCSPVEEVPAPRRRQPVGVPLAQHPGAATGCGDRIEPHEAVEGVEREHRDGGLVAPET